ncbi:MAG: hypothetical protein HC880_03180 [Bacteroidia bacterium]|nr:hypothetical protein [Bacteroidia bacterium]
MDYLSIRYQLEPGRDDPQYQEKVGQSIRDLPHWIHNLVLLMKDGLATPTSVQDD